MTADGTDLIELAGPADFATTLQRVTDAILAAGLTIFARVDHAENARAAGLAMPPATVLLYGNAKGGTPIMLAAPHAALDLPLRVLVRQTPTGSAIAYYPIAPILLDAGLPADLARRLDPAQRILPAAMQP